MDDKMTTPVNSELLDYDRVTALACTAVGNVCEWDDRTSPGGFEDYIFLRPAELQGVLVDFAAVVLQPDQSRRSQPSGEPVVKALEWKDTKFGSEAASAVGRCVVEDMGDNWTNDRYWLQLEKTIGQFPTIEAAKAYAQADYEQRIMSALVTVASHETPIPATQAGLSIAGETEEPVAYIVTRPMRSGKIGMHLPFLRAGEEADRYQASNPDETLLPLYASPPIEPAGITITDEMVGRMIKALRPLVFLSYAEAKPALTAALEGK